MIEVVNRLAPATDIFVEIESNDELGAPPNPTGLDVQMFFSPTRRLPDAPAWVDVSWFADNDSVPARYYAKGTVLAGDLTEGMWWPFVLIANDPEAPIVAGPPFRVE